MNPTVEATVACQFRMATSATRIAYWMRVQVPPTARNKMNLRRMTFIGLLLLEIADRAWEDSLTQWGWRQKRPLPGGREGAMISLADEPQLQDVTGRSRGLTCEPAI